MTRFDVYQNPDGAGYLLDVQADLLKHLNTRVVVPLMAFNDAPRPAKRLNPTFQVGGEDVIMVTQFLATVPLSILKTPVASLEPRHFEIINAIDMIMQGF